MTNSIDTNSPKYLSTEVLTALFTNIKFPNIVIILFFILPQFGMPESASVVEKVGMNGSHFLVSKYFIRAVIQVYFSMRLLFLTVLGNKMTLSFSIHTSLIVLISHFSGFIYRSDFRNSTAQQKSYPPLPCLQRKHR